MEILPPRVRAWLPCFPLLLLPAAAPLSGADCNHNGAEDAEEIRSGAAPDCNRNGRPDACDLAPARGVLEPSSSTPTGVPRDGPLELADFDGDGFLDALSGSPVHGKLMIHRGGPAGFAPGGANLDVHPFVMVWVFAAADLTGDGLTDVALVTARADDQVLELRRGTGAGFSPPEELTGLGRGTFRLLAEDLDGDGRPEIIEAAYGEVCIHWNDGGAFGQPAVLMHHFSGAFLQVLDVDGDGRLDLLAAAPQLIVGSLSRSEGARSWSDFARYNLPAPPLRLASGDLDGDGDDDLLLSDREGNVHLASFTGAAKAWTATATPFPMSASRPPGTAT